MIMKYLAIFLFFGCTSSMSLQSQNDVHTKADIVALLSSHTSPSKLDNFVKNLALNGLDMNIEEIRWKGDEQLDMIHFDIKTTGGKEVFKPAIFNYNLLNESVVLVIYSNRGGHVVLTASAGLITEELWNSVLIKTDEVKRVISSFYRPINSASREELRILFDNLNKHFATNHKLLKQVREDRDFSKVKHHYHYYFNGERLLDSFHLPVTDMSASVELKEDAEGYLSIYITSKRAISTFALKR